MKIKWYISGILLMIMGISWQASGSEEPIRLIENNSTGYRVMVGPGASPVEDFAAQELQGYIMQISGVFLPMDRGNARTIGKHILVGKGAATRLGLEVDREFLGPDGFIIRTLDDKIILVGGSPRGTLYGVYAFLEMLGCRWMAPGMIGEVIPQSLDIVIEPTEHLERPDIKYRGFTYSLPVIRDGTGWIDWMAKNRMNYLMVDYAGYAEFKTYLAGELEKRGLWTGVSFDICTSEDQVLKFVAENPEVGIIELRGECCAETIIKTAEAINSQYPEKLIFLTKHDEKISEGNAVFYFEPASRCYRHFLGDEKCEINSGIRVPFEAELKTWGRAHIREHYMGTYGQSSLPFPILNTIAWDLEYFKRLGSVESVISQCEPGNWGTYGLNYYVFARKMWNADRDLGSIVDDYCEKYYGSASDPMRRYFARLEDAMAEKKHFQYVDPPELILELLDEKALADLEHELQNAVNLAGDAIIFDRIRKSQLSFEHTKLLWHTLNHYSKAIQLEKAENLEEASEHFKQAVQMSEGLVAFLFQNIEEEVFIISEEYIFDYLEVLIADARERQESLNVY